jgi:hypothetical protein
MALPVHDYCSVRSGGCQQRAEREPGGARPKAPQQRGFDPGSMNAPAHRSNAHSFSAIFRSAAVLFRFNARTRGWARDSQTWQTDARRARLLYPFSVRIAAEARDAGAISPTQASAGTRGNGLTGTGTAGSLTEIRAPLHAAAGPR